ncbi:hypothetical protein [Thalassotalea marina]|uniref:hypothetical protein n=1 Tax=Thalassotalea marina TaxID=1673741 RepID=UPI00167B008D|nr:hypothetical protein [Thalassotalea marina]
MLQNSIHFCSIGKGYKVECGSVDVLDGDYEASFNRLKHQSLSGLCHLILSSKYNQIVQLDKPALPAEELNTALRWQVKDLVTISPENMITDYYDGVLNISGQEKINVVCANKQEIQPWLAELSQGDVFVEAISIEEFAFASIVPAEEHAKLLLCQQPNEDMLILIVKQGRLFFQRRLRGMATIGNKSEVELDMGTIDTLSIEIQRSADYFERQLKQAPIQQIDVLLPIESESYIARRLAENSNVPVNIFSMPEGFEQYRSFAAAIGATRMKISGEVSS